MRELLIQLGGLLGYILAGRLVMKALQGWWRELAFTGLNLAALYAFFFYDKGGHHVPAFIAYLVLVGVQYLMLRLFAEQKGWLPWLAFFTPILFLILVRYAPSQFSMQVGGHQLLDMRFIGISYLAFRSSHLVLEIRNGVVTRPGFLDYLGFCFFVPTMSVGPINPYSNYRRAFGAQPPEIPASRAWLRILVGFVKYKFLGSIWFRLTYTNLLFDDHYHPGVDLFVAMIFYYLYLYCNFSGFCDMAIGAAGLMGIPVSENFNNPFAARNIKDFWNRWHITLSQYMRDVVFAPLSKFLVRLGGPAMADHAIAVTIVVVFLLVGVWHGVGWNFAAYGAVHALGVAANHYYTIGLKKWLGREGFKAYNANPWIHGVAVVLTFGYCAASLIFFANTFPQMKEMFSLIR
jgi:D-alanyl-lipoteichoic acid acyltransferase DltB (MBOAT superfamily)